MSERIRLNLDRHRASSQRHCAEYEAMIAAYPVPWDIKTKADFNVTMKRLQKDLKKLEDSFDEWNTYVDGLKADDGQQAERDLFIEWKDDYIYVKDDLDKYILTIDEYKKLQLDTTTTSAGPPVRFSSCVKANLAPPSQPTTTPSIAAGIFFASKEVRGKSKDGAALAVESGTKSGDARKNAGCKSDGATCARRDNDAESCISAAAVDNNVKCDGSKGGRGVPAEGRGAGSKDYVGATTVMFDVPPGFEQQQQCYLDAPPGFEFAVASTSTLSSTATELLPDHPQRIFQARDQCSFCVQDDGMSLKIVGGEDLSEKASYSSMPVSRGSNVMEGRKKYGIFCRPTIRVTAIARSRPHGSNVRDASSVRSRSCAWDTVLYQIDRGPSTYIVYDAFIIIVFDGGGKFSSTVIVILDALLELQYADRDKTKMSNDLCCLRGWWQCRGDSAIFFSFIALALC